MQSEAMLKLTQEVEYFKSLYEDTKKGYEKMVDEIKLLRGKEREEIVNELLKSGQMKKLVTIRRIPPYARTPEEVEFIKTVTSCDRPITKSTFILELPHGKVFCYDLSEIVRTVEYYDDLVVTFINIRLKYNDKVYMYPLDEVQSSEFLIKLGANSLDLSTKNNILYPELKELKNYIDETKAKLDNKIAEMQNLVYLSETQI